MIKDAVERSYHEQSRYYVDIFIEDLRKTLKSLARIVGVLSDIRTLHLQPGSLCHCSPFFIFLGQLLGTHVLDAPASQPGVQSLYYFCFTLCSCFLSGYIVLYCLIFLPLIPESASLLPDVCFRPSVSRTVLLKRLSKLMPHSFT
jgi:hypothetical protein